MQTRQERYHEPSWDNPRLSYLQERWAQTGEYGLNLKLEEELP